MSDGAIVNELFLPFGFEGYRWSAYCVCNITLAVLCSISLAVATGHNTHRLARPAFMVATLTHLIFQWPLALFSPIFENFFSTAFFWISQSWLRSEIVFSFLTSGSRKNRYTRNIIPISVPTDVNNCSQVVISIFF